MIPTEPAPMSLPRVVRAGAASGARRRPAVLTAIPTALFASPARPAQPRYKPRITALSSVPDAPGGATRSVRGAPSSLGVPLVYPPQGSRDICQLAKLRQADVRHQFPGGSKPAMPSTTEHSRSTFNCGRTVTLAKPSRGGRNPEPETGGRESAPNRDRGYTPPTSLERSATIRNGTNLVRGTSERSCTNASSDTSSLTFAFAGLTQRTGRRRAAVF